jgi:GxxExxY protein
MDTNSGKLLAKEEVFQIVGCAIEVLNTLGHGLLEKPYENALAVEFGLRNVPFASNLCSMSSTKNIRSVSSSPT